MRLEDINFIKRTENLSISVAVKEVAQYKIVKKVTKSDLPQISTQK